jgi:hypothetical protein
MEARLYHRPIFGWSIEAFDYMLTVCFQTSDHIYIYIYRERERERENHKHINNLVLYYLKEIIKEQGRYIKISLT